MAVIKIAVIIRIDLSLNAKCYQTGKKENSATISIKKS